MLSKVFAMIFGRVRLLLFVATCYNIYNANTCLAESTEKKGTFCGKQHLRLGRIVGGDAAYDGEFPWMVSILLNGAHFCGGALIGPKWILTAAHCVQKYSKTSYRARLGEYRLSSREEGHSSVDRSIERIIIHPNYSLPIRYYNDLALLKLSHDVDYSDYISPICLPYGQENNDYMGEEATVAGWGWMAELKEAGGKRSDILRKVILPVVRKDECERWFTKAGKYIRFQGAQMCAGFMDGKKDSCQGDSGGPLMLKDDKEQFSLIGVVSAGIGCARPLLPGLYTKVSAYLQWIDELMN